jgi:phospholipase C
MRLPLRAGLCLALWGALVPPVAAQAPRGIDKLSHILVLYLENRSFDNIFGEFPGANGLAGAGAATIQRDGEGKPFATLPAGRGPFDRPGNPADIRALAPLDNLPNAPFDIAGVHPEVTSATFTRDLIHSFYTNRSQIHAGKNDWFALKSDANALAMGYYGANSMRRTNLWKIAEANTLLDNFFMGAFGGSFLNHVWLVCACAPVWPDPPASVRSEVAGDGHVVRDRQVVAEADGDYAVNTVQSIYLNNGRQGGNLLPPQTAPTIGDRLTERGVDWAWYAGGWSLATKAGRTANEETELARVAFQWHHQPFAYFARFNPTSEKGRSESAAHLRDDAALAGDIRAGRLPPVAFYKPVGVLNQHPGYANLVPGDEEIQRIVMLMDQSPMKDSYAIIITYDENGGFFDHVAPPQGPAAGARADFFGPGSRVPTIVVSPFTRGGRIDHTEYDTTSVLKLIGERHRLEPLPSPRYGAVESLAKAFDFSR